MAVNAKRKQAWEGVGVGAQGFRQLVYTGRVQRVHRGSPYVQDWLTQNYVQDAGLTGRGGPSDRPDVWKIVTKTRGGAA